MAAATVTACDARCCDGSTGGQAGGSGNQLDGLDGGGDDDLAGDQGDRWQPFVGVGDGQLDGHVARCTALMCAFRRSQYRIEN